MSSFSNLILASFQMPTSATTAPALTPTHAEIWLEDISVSACQVGRARTVTSVSKNDTILMRPKYPAIQSLSMTKNRLKYGIYYKTKKSGRKKWAAGSLVVEVQQLEGKKMGFMVKSRKKNLNSFCRYQRLSRSVSEWSHMPGELQAIYTLAVSFQACFFVCVSIYVCVCVHDNSRSDSPNFPISLLMINSFVLFRLWLLVFFSVILLLTMLHCSMMEVDHVMLAALCVCV